MTTTIHVAPGLQRLVQTLVIAGWSDDQILSMLSLEPRDEVWTAIIRAWCDLDPKTDKYMSQNNERSIEMSKLNEVKEETKKSTVLFDQDKFENEIEEIDDYECSDDSCFRPE